MTMPEQKPHRSTQEVRTPSEFLRAVVRRFGPITVDLAASNDNAVAPIHLGPDSNIPDALSPLAAWHLWERLLWLNPPFGNMTPWVQKCCFEQMAGARIALLAPASVGSNWFNEWVRPHAYVLELSPRLTFVGHAHAYPKDLILALYTPELFVGREAWHWRMGREAANDNGVDPRQMALPIVGVEAAS